MPSDNLGAWLDLLGRGLFGILQLAICGFFCVIGVKALWRAIRLSRCGVRVTARIVGNYVNPKDAERAQYRIVEFSDLQGTTHHTRLPISASFDPSVSQEMLVLYNPNDPNEVSGTTFGHLWLVPLLCFVLVGAVILFSPCRPGL